MKCYTVTENGITPGIEFSADAPYPHVTVGDPHNVYLMRRVKVGPTLAAQSPDGMIRDCAIALDTNDDDRRRASYDLVAADRDDPDHALVKLEARCGRHGRTWYWLPRDAFSVAVGEYAETGGHRTRAPVNLLVMHTGDVVEICNTEGVWAAPEHVFDVRYDGRKLAQATHAPA